jgi:hypothetical protein
MVDRRRLDEALTKAAQDKGAEPVENCRVTSVYRQKERMYVQTDRRIFQSRVILRRWRQQCGQALYASEREKMVLSGGGKAGE